MSAEANLYHEPPAATEAQRELQLTGEQTGIPPILLHFYGYCRQQGLEVDASNPEEGPALAAGIYDYLAQAIEDLNQKHAAGGKSGLLHTPKRHVQKYLDDFYREHGAAIPSDSIVRGRRTEYLQRGAYIAHGVSYKYPEIDLTETLAACLDDAGHALAADSAFTLLAVTGESFAAFVSNALYFST